MRDANGNGANRIVWAVAGTLSLVAVTTLIALLTWLCVTVNSQSIAIAGLTGALDSMRETLTTLIQRIP